MRRDPDSQWAIQSNLCTVTAIAWIAAPAIAGSR